METLLSLTAKENMRKTSGWMRFYCITLFILIPFFFYIAYRIQGLPSPPNFPISFTSLSLIIDFSGLVLLVFSIYLFRYAIALKRTAETDNLKLLETGFQHYLVVLIISGIGAIFSALAGIYSLIATF